MLKALYGVPSGAISVKAAYTANEDDDSRGRGEVHYDPVLVDTPSAVDAEEARGKRPRCVSICFVIL